MRRPFILASLILAGASCSNAKLETANSGAQSIAIGSQKSQDAVPDGDVNEGGVPTEGTNGESADRPVSITGAYLYCASLLDATDASLTTVIGCRATGIDLGANYSVDYSLSLATVPGVTATQKILTDLNRKNDIVFYFTGTTRAASIQGSRESKVVMKVKDLATGITESKAALKIASVLNGKSATPEFKLVNFEGSELFYVIDEQTGKNWSVDNGQGYTFLQAKAYCDSFGLGDDTSWRLPTITELQTLFGSDPTSVVGMNISSVKFGGYWSSTLAVGTNLAWRINLGALDVNSATSPLDFTTMLSVICVR